MQKKLAELNFYQWALISCLWIACVVIAVQYEVDFTVMHQAAKVASVDPVYAYSPDLMYSGGPRFYYGPVTLFLNRPLGWLPFQAAKFFWIVFQSAAFWTFWFLLAAAFPSLKNQPLKWVLVFSVSLNPVHLNFQSNNIQLIILSILMASEVFSRKRTYGWRFLSGVLVAIVSLVKIYPLFIAAYYFIVKKAPTRWGIATGFLLGILLPFADFGMAGGARVYGAFFNALGKYHGANSFADSLNLQCLQSFLMRTLPSALTTEPLFTVIANGAFVIIALSFFIFIFINRKQCVASDTFQKYTWTLALALMTFLNPSSLGHYLVFYVPAVAAAMELGKKSEKRFNPNGVLVWIGALTVALSVDGVVGKPTSHELQRLAVPAFGMLLICWGLWWSVCHHLRALAAKA